MPLLSLAPLSNRELAWAAGLLLAFALAVGFLLLQPRNELRSRGNRPLPLRSLRGPILQIELAPSERVIDEILLAGESRANIADARAGNRLDTWFFIPAYAGWLALLGLLLARGERRWPEAVLLASLVSACVIAVADWIENAAIERALNHVESLGSAQPGDARATALPSLVKWTLLGVLLLAYAVIAVRQPGIALKSLALLLTAVSAAVWITLFRYFQEIR